MDHFYEESIGNSRLTSTRVWRTALLVLGILMALVAVYFVLNLFLSLGGGLNSISLIFSVNAAVLSGLCFFMRGQIRLEYEYTLEGDVFRLTKVINDARRKRLCEFPVRDMERIGMARGDFVAEAMANRAVKKFNAIVHRDVTPVYLYFRQGKNASLVLLEPTDKRLGFLKDMNPTAFEKGKETA